MGSEKDCATCFNSIWQMVNIAFVSYPWGKKVQFLLPSVGHWADPGVQTVARSWHFKSFQAVGCHYCPQSLRWPSNRTPASLDWLGLYCLVTKAHWCVKLAQGCYLAFPRWKLHPRRIDRKSNPYRYAAAPLGTLLSFLLFLRFLGYSTEQTKSETNNNNKMWNATHGNSNAKITINNLTVPKNVKKMVL